MLIYAFVKVLIDLKMPENSQSNQSGDFASPRWSVIDSESCQASGLSYESAIEKVRELSAMMHGLCIVTDQAANRLRPQNGKSEIAETEDLTGKSFSELL